MNDLRKIYADLMYEDTGEDPRLRGVPESMLENGKLKAVFRADVGLRKPAGDSSYTFTDNQTRRVEVLPNTEGHSAYPLLEPGDGYLVTIYKEVLPNTEGHSEYPLLEQDDGYLGRIYNEKTGRPLFGTKPMDIVEVSDSYVELRGTSVLAISPFGLVDPGNEDFGCRVYFSAGVPSGFWLHRYDTGIDYLYASKQEVLARNVRSCTDLLDAGDEPALREALHSLAAFMGGPGRISIIKELENKLPLAECMIRMNQLRVWEDSSSPVTAAEIALYCLREALLDAKNDVDKTVVCLDLFQLLASSQEFLQPLLARMDSESPFRDILRAIPTGGTGETFDKLAYFASTMIGDYVRSGDIPMTPDDLSFYGRCIQSGKDRGLTPKECPTDLHKLADTVERSLVAEFSCKDMKYI